MTNFAKFRRLPPSASPSYITKSLPRMSTDAFPPFPAQENDHVHHVHVIDRPGKVHIHRRFRGHIVSAARELCIRTASPHRDVMWCPREREWRPVQEVEHRSRPARPARAVTAPTRPSIGRRPAFTGRYASGRPPRARAYSATVPCQEEPIPAVQPKQWLPERTDWPLSSSRESTS